MNHNIKAIINKQGMNYSAIADNDLSLIAKIVDNIDNDKELDLSSFWPLGDNSTSFTS